MKFHCIFAQLLKNQSFSTDFSQSILKGEQRKVLVDDKNYIAPNAYDGNPYTEGDDICGIVYLMLYANRVNIQDGEKDWQIKEIKNELTNER